MQEFVTELGSGRSLLRIHSFVARFNHFMRHTASAVKAVVRHDGIPRPIRWLAAVGLLPIPGPFDEVVLLLVAAVLLLFYRDPLREAWRNSDGVFSAPPK